MGVGAGLYMYVVIVQKFTFAISSPDEFLFIFCITRRFYSCPLVWNSLEPDLRSAPSLASSISHLKTHCSLPPIVYIAQFTFKQQIQFSRDLGRCVNLYRIERCVLRPKAIELCIELRLRDCNSWYGSKAINSSVPRRALCSVCVCVCDSGQVS